MRVPYFMLVFSMFIYATTGVSKSEECISSPTPSVSDSILNNLNSTSCLTLRSKQEVLSPEVIPLQVNRSCANGSDVEIMGLISGIHNCPEMKFLFAPRKGTDCMRKKLCQATRMKHYGRNRTLCLLQCKKYKQDDVHYGLELISGIQESNIGLCGLKLYQDHCAKNPCGSNEICDDNIDSYNCTFQNVTSGAGTSEIADQTTSLMVTDGTWNQPSGWTGPSTVLYRSFYSSDGLVLMEGTEPAVINSVHLVSGKVNNALSLDHTKRQWVDLGIHTEACMTRQETCGAAGGSISLWANLIDCTSGGIISSSGSMIACNGASFSFLLNLQDGRFSTSHSKPTGWTHVVLNYIGPYNGEGIRIYYDGEEVASGATKYATFISAGDGRMVVGRRYPYQDWNYASVQVDELIYFNAALTSDDVQLIYNSA